MKNGDDCVYKHSPLTDVYDDFHASCDSPSILKPLDIQKLDKAKLVHHPHSRKKILKAELKEVKYQDKEREKQRVRNGKYQVEEIGDDRD